jgi:hypothetical protein
MKYRVIRLQEIANPGFVADLGDLSKEERAEKVKEPQYIYEVDLQVEDGHCAGAMTLRFKYVPMLNVGAVYTAQELEEM